MCFSTHVQKSLGLSGEKTNDSAEIKSINTNVNFATITVMSTVTLKVLSLFREKTCNDSKLPLIGPRLG